jgi:carbon monoxide dehydrogenase subunit G
VQLDQSFTVPVPVEEAWQILLDLPRIAPCMPGATLIEFDGEAFAGTVKVKVGPIVLNYRGTGRFVQRDEAARRVVIEASGRDSRAAGTAAATVTMLLKPQDTVTRVEVVTDLTITGRPAQFGRGMLADISAKLIGQFADCVAVRLGEPAPAGSVAVQPVAVQPVAVQPVAVQPVAVQPVAVQPVAVQPVAVQPVAVQPEAARSEPAQPAATWSEPVRAAEEAQPIDLLKLTGGTAAARRWAGYALIAGAVAVAAWRLIRRRRT